MLLVNKNNNGRIYVKKILVECMIYNFFKYFYPEIKCYSVKYDNAEINVFVSGINNLNYEYLVIIQDNAKEYFGDSLGLYIQNFNIIIK